MRWALAAAALCAVLNTVSMRLRPEGWPLLQGLAPEAALETSALVSLGMRRLAADLGLVRLLIYYGSADAAAAEEEETGHDRHSHGAFDPAHPERSWGGGVYGELGPRALRALDADPSFSYVALYAAGALAFNLNRPDEALRVIRYALSRDPRNHRYQAYAAAIGLHRHGDAAGVIRLLEPALPDADCPVMIKHLVAYLYARTGRRERALALYRDIRDTSKDAGYRRMAAEAVSRLAREKLP